MNKPKAESHKIQKKKQKKRKKWLKGEGGGKNVERMRESISRHS